MTAQPHEPITHADFPAWELAQQSKHEFVNGHVYGFAGGTVEHNTLQIALASAIFAHLRGGPCRTFGADMLIEMTSSTRYADVVVTCDQRDQSPGAAVIRFPNVIVEVLSESTAGQDLGTKLREYQGIETLQEYIVVDSRKRWVQAIRRRGRDWIITVVSPEENPQLPVTFESIDLTLELDEFYALAGIDR